MKKWYLFVIGIFILLQTACTENQRAKTFGGTQKIQMLPNEKLINMTWKNNNLWILSEDTITRISYQIGVY